MYSVFFLSSLSPKHSLTLTVYVLEKKVNKKCSTKYYKLDLEPIVDFSQTKALSFWPMGVTDTKENE